MTTLTPTPKQQFLDANGNPLVGGKVYTYAAGTTTPLATYTDSTGSTPNTNPVILDSRGEAAIWLGTASYKLKLTTSTDAEIWTVDNIVSASAQALSDLSQSGGSALVGYLPAGTGAIATTVQAKLRQTVSPKDFGAIANDSSTAAKLANNTAFAACLTQCGYLRLDANYYTSQPIDIGFNQKIYGNGYTIYPAQNTRCVRIRSSRWTISDLNIDYVTQQGVADTSAVGILFNKGAFEGVISNVMINKSYRGVSLGNDVDAADSFVYMALITSVRVLDAYDWGIYLANAGSIGMTTNTLVNCYVLQSTIGANASSKGMYYAFQTGGLSLINCAVDKCSGRAMLLNGCTAFSVNGFYAEANVIAGTHLIEANSCTSSYLLGVTSYANTFSGTSSIVRVSGTSGQITVSGREQGSVNTGTLYGVLADATGTDVWVEALGFVTNSSLARSDGAVSGGRRQIASYAGQQLSDKKLGKYIEYRNSAPTTGTWQLGDETQPDALVVGDPFGYYCAVAGTPGTWVTKGGQIGYRTNAGTPVGVLTPKFIGEEVLNTTGNLWFKATGLTVSDWQGL